MQLWVCLPLHTHLYPDTSLPCCFQFTCALFVWDSTAQLPRLSVCLTVCEARWLPSTWRQLQFLWKCPPPSPLTLCQSHAHLMWRSTLETLHFSCKLWNFYFTCHSCCFVAECVPVCCLSVCVCLYLCIFLCVCVASVCFVAKLMPKN